MGKEKEIVVDHILKDIVEPEDSRVCFHGKTVLKDRVRYFANPGKRYQPKYKKYFDKNGEVTVTIVDYVNLYDFIQSSKDESNIDVLYNRFVNGDNSVKRNAITVAGKINDFCNVPKDIIEANNYIINVKESFDSLPIDLKAKFDNNYMKFANSSRDGSAINIVKDYLKKTYKDVNDDNINDKLKGEDKNENG